jgi:hypothetical protein
MAIDLTNEQLLRDASQTALELHRRQYHLGDWLENLSVWLRRVAEVDRATFVSSRFQQELWENETISATGQGHIDVSKVFADPSIAERLWDLKQTSLPENDDARGEWLASAWDDIAAMVKPLTTRTPRLKMFRVFASLWPDQFSTVAHLHKLRQLARAMGVGRGVEHRVQFHQRVLERLDAVNAVDRTGEFWHLERMTLPWLLFVHFIQEKGSDATEVPSDIPGEVRLNPLPADRRRRGMLAIGGMIPSILAMLEFAKDGCKRTDFLEHIRSINSKLSSASLGTNLNALIAEWGVLRAEGDDVYLTPRGEALLESGEPEDVSDWLLTRILGFDNLLYMLRESPLPHKQAIANLQQVNPGWTTDFAPNVLVNWAKGMELAEAGSDRVLRLTERGRQWASRIHWIPGVLPLVVKPVPVVPPTSAGNGGSLRERLPSPTSILAGFPADIAFSPQLVAKLHAGLWSHERRHFAVLTGLSGAGKTQLALCYAKGLWADADGQEGWYIVPVQPGWHDPSSLLGYVNPINNEVYVRTGFLDFLMQAQANPDRPYVVLLDEMNLSHPEQYLAPLLSAMETGGDIELHSLGDEVNGVPSHIPYPENLVLIGTVNMDETTHGLSDKVLDRASVIEFWDIDVDRYPGWTSSRLDPSAISSVREALKALVGQLRPLRLHFGWRTIGDVLGYTETAVRGGLFSVDEALDQAIYSKVLPKLRGEDTPRLRECFDSVAKLLGSRNLTESASKVIDLGLDLRHLGSARFWR